ncbi:MAG TPA: hypothetical protein VL500_07670 [Candidatus Eisenbacteria bacterium]|jgi:hypothetical protein|nr:hypothetical protein [Candidatus Eisenbacteria bacterium]
MQSRSLTPQETGKIDLILRVAMFGEFLGHGVLAWQKTPKFLTLLGAMTGIKGPLAGQLMQAVGAFDIVMAVVVLVKPIRILLAWGALWALATAIARPVAGDPIWDLIERAANVGVPLALLYVRGMPKTAKEWFS